MSSIGTAACVAVYLFYLCALSPQPNEKFLEGLSPCVQHMSCAQTEPMVKHAHSVDKWDFPIICIFSALYDVSLPMTLRVSPSNLSLYITPWFTSSCWMLRMVFIFRKDIPTTLWNSFLGLIWKTYLQFIFYRRYHVLPPSPASCHSGKPGY